MVKIGKKIIMTLLVVTLSCSSIVYYQNQSKAAETSISISDMVVASVASQGAAVDMGKYTYQLVFGKVGSSEHAGNNFTDQWGQPSVNYIPQGESAVKAYTATGLKCTAQCLGSMVKITAKETISVRFTHPTIQGISGVGFIYIKVFHVVDGMPQVVSSIPLSDQNVAANYYTPKTVIAKAGESVYWSYETSNQWGFVADLSPSVEIGNAAEIENDSLTLNDMVAGTVVKKGNEVNTEFVKYQLITGKYDNPIKFNTFFTDTGSGDWEDNWRVQYKENDAIQTAIEINNFNNYPKCGNLFTSQAASADTFKDDIIKLSINKDCKINITHPAVPENEWRGSHTLLRMVLKRPGMTTAVLFDKIVPSSAIDANTYGISDLSLKMGDILYYIYTSKNEYGSNISLTPTFSFTKTAFIPTVPETETLNVSNFVLGMNESNGEPIGSELASYQIVTGKIGNETKMKYFSNAKAEFTWYGTEDTDKDKKTTFVTNNTLQASQDHDCILKLTANKNLKVNLSHPELKSWVGPNGRFKVVIVSNGQSCVMKDTGVSDKNTAANYYFDGANELYLRAGDILYLDLYTINDWHFYADIIPVIQISTKSFDDNKTVAKTIESRTSSKNLIDKYVACLSMNNYTDENWTSIQNIAALAKANIDMQTSITEIVDIKDQAIADIRAVLPKSNVPYEILTTTDMIKNMKKTNGKPCDTAYVTYQLLTGKIGKEIKMNNFTLKGETSLGGSNDKDVALYCPPGVKDVNSMVAITGESFQAVNGYDAMIKLIVHKNGQLRITHPKVRGWIPDYTKIKVVRIRGGKTEVISDKFISTLASPDSFYTPEIGAVKMNDIIYIDYYTTNAYYGSVSFAPIIEIGDIQKKNNEEVIDITSLISDSISGYGSKISCESGFMELLYGKLGAAGKFNNHDSSSVWNKGTSFAGSTTGFSNNGVIKTSSTSDAIIKFTAKKKAAFSIAVKSGTFPDGSNITVYQEINGKVYLVKKATGSFTVEVSSNVDDRIYFVFSTTKKTAQWNISTTMKADTDKFNEFEIPNDMKTESYTLKDMVGQVEFQKDFKGVQDRYLSTFELIAGSVGKQTEYLKVKNTYPDLLTDLSGATMIVKDQMTAGMLGNDAIIKITAKKNCKLIMTHPEITYLWPGNTGIKLIGESEGVRIVVKDTRMANTKKGADYYLKDIDLKAGDSIYIDYYSTDSYYGIIDMFPTFTFDTTKYDSKNRPGYDAIKLVNDKIEEKCRALTAYLGSLNKDLYSTINWLSLGDIVDNAQEEMRALTSAVSVNERYEKAISDMKAIKTLDQEKTQLASLKVSRIQELETYVNSLNENTYAKGSWNTVKKIQGQYIEIMNNATNTTSVEVAFQTAKSSIAKISKTVGESTVTNLIQQKSNGMVYILIIIIASVLVITSAVIFVMIKKKKSPIATNE